MWKANRCSNFFNASVSAIARADLEVGLMLDGESGFTIYDGVQPSVTSVIKNYLPLGLANHARLIRPVKKDQPITFEDVEIETTSPVYTMRINFPSLAQIC